MDAKRVLLVEGTDDEHVMKHLIRHGQLPHLDDIFAVGSVSELLEIFPIRLKESDLGVLGMVIDANSNIAARWQSVRDRLRVAGYKVPNQPNLDGTILEPPSDELLPRVGIWMMPDNRAEGILEDFLRFLVPSGSSLFAHVEHSVDGIPTSERRFSTAVRSKALLHTWLAWQREPGKPLGTAITAKYLDANVAEVELLLSWLRRLFFSE